MSNGRWWRAYNEARDDPKLQKLSGSLFKSWFNLMCIASDYDGALPPIDDLAFKLRMSSHKANELISSLTEAGLLDEIDGTIQPHNWSGRQFKTDATDPTNAVRQKRYRNAKRNGGSNGPQAVTSKRPDTEAEQKQSRSRARNGVTPDADAAAAAAVPNEFDRISKSCHDALPAECTWKIRTSEDISPIVSAMKDGADLEKDVVPAIKAAAERALKNGRDVGSWKFFEQAVRDHYASRIAANGSYSINSIVKPKKEFTPEHLELMAKIYGTNLCEVWHWRDIPAPGKPGCPIPPEVLRKHGVDPETGKRAERK